MTRIWPGIPIAAALAACTAPEPTAQVPDWLRPPEERAQVPLSEKPGDPRWLVLPELARCDANLAAAPAAVGRDLEWKPCPGGQVGCRALIADRVTERGVFGTGLTYQLHAGWTASGVMLAIHEAIGGTEREHISLAPLDGPPFLVLDMQRRSGDCDFVRADFADAGAAIVLAHGGVLDRQTIYLGGPLRSDPMWHRPLAHGPQFGSVSIAGRSIITVGGDVRRSDPQTGEFIQFTDDTTAICCGYAVGTSIVFLGPGQIRVAVTPGAPSRVLHTRSGSGTVTGLVAQDGVLYWAEGAGARPKGGYDSIELWTAPATDDPAHFAPRRITELGLHSLPDRHAGLGETDELMIGGGKIAVRYNDASGTARLIVVDGATGERRTWQPRPDVAPLDLLFVSPHEVGVAINVDDNHAYMRVRLDAMAPTTAP
jgi:hypothetical protein